MQQLYTDNISTQFQNDPNNPGGDQIPVQVGIFRHDSSLAKAIGIPELIEEATNFSLGTVINIIDNINLTFDWYSIDIEDCIVLSNSLKCGLSTTLDAALMPSRAGAGQFFFNGADTRSVLISLLHGILSY